VGNALLGVHKVYRKRSRRRRKRKRGRKAALAFLAFGAGWGIKNDSHPQPISVSEVFHRRFIPFQGSARPGAVLDQNRSTVQRGAGWRIKTDSHPQPISVSEVFHRRFIPFQGSGRPGAVLGQNRSTVQRTHLCTYCMYCATRAPASNFKWYPAALKRV
jgi:hypothetical protein